jgi:chromosome segregation ATPase
MSLNMHISSKQFIWSLIVLSSLLFAMPVHAVKRDESADKRIAAKLQAMVREVSAERDRLKTENATLAAENEQLKEQLSAEKQMSEAAASVETKLTGELSAAQGSNERLSSQLDKTRSKLHEVIVKYKQLNQEKKQLTAQFTELQQTQQFTATELDGCENKNLELLKTTRTMMENFNSRGLFDTLLGKEPILGFNGVEIENMIQEYQDKLVEHQYLRKTEADVAAEAPPEESETGEVEEAESQAETQENVGNPSEEGQ